MITKNDDKKMFDVYSRPTVPQRMKPKLWELISSTRKQMDKNILWT